MINFSRVKNWSIYIWIIFFTIFHGRVYFATGVPITHDGENHLARFANYKVALKEGQLPPRFAPNLVNHYGYPVFNYNYPLANILSVPFSVLKIHYELTFKIIMLVFVAAGLAGIATWLRLLSYGQQAQAFGVAIFALSPYLFNALVFRGNVGEVMALGLLPWLIVGIEVIRQRSVSRGELIVLIMTWTAFLLSHNVTVVFGVPLVLGYGLLRVGTAYNYWKVIGTCIVTAVGATLWFWLPALAEKSQIIVDTAAASLTFADHFPTLKQLILAPLTFGYSYLGSVDSLSYAMGSLQILTVLIALLLITKNRWISKQYAEQNKVFIVALSGLVVLFLLQLSLAKPLWTLIPVLRFIQFPWRLGLFSPLLLAPVAAEIWQRLPRKGHALLILATAAQLFSMLIIKPVGYLHQEKLTYEQFTQSTSTANENLPKTFTYTDFSDWLPTAEIVEGKGRVEVIKWSGSERTYRVFVDEKVTVIEPTMYFLGWQTTAQRGHDVWRQQLPYLITQQWGGRIAYQLDPGEYLVRSQFTQQTPARLVGNSVSLATVIGMILYATWPVVKKYVLVKYSKR
ncbi:MAG TPA: hypothetical protein VD999_05275 [Vitreimonas sp.]|nr:hypothetical protein [Vitreimonas sp.]